MTYSTQDRAAIGGWGAANTNVFNIETGRLPDYNQPDDGTNCAGADSYNATTNPTGVRCTFQDFMVSISVDASQDGYANLVWDNVGVQYGLISCNPASITPEKFVDVNVRAGGFDVNGVWQPQRSEMTPEVAAMLHRTGQVTFGKNLGDVAGDRDPRHQQQRLPLSVPHVRQPGAADRRERRRRQPRVLDATPATVSTLIAMDRWLAAVEADARRIRCT